MGNETLTEEEIEALVYILDNLSQYEYSLDYIDTSLIFTKKQLPTSDDIVKGQTFINLQVLVDAIKEFKEAKTYEEKEDELGDILFAVVNLARWNKIDAEQALIKANKKFTSRFKLMEANAQKELEHLSLEEWDNLWKKAKKLTESN